MVHPVLDGGLVRCYLLSSPEGLVVVDPGSRGTAEAAVSLIRRMPGRTMADVRSILATHFHFDHIGGIGTLLRYCPAETRILFPRHVRGYLRRERPLPSLQGWLSEFVPTSLKCSRYLRRPSHLGFESLAGIPLPGFGNRFRPPIEEERILYLGGEGGDGDRRYGLGFDGWEVIETPGHTEESVCLYHEGRRELLCGDLILNLEKEGEGRLNRFCEDREKAEASFRHLRENTRPRLIFPGHGEVIQDEENALLRVRSGR